MTLSVIGIDIAKRVFQLHGVDEHGRTVLRKRLTRATFLLEMTALPPCVVGMEAGSGAHHWGRCLADMGHDVRLMPPQYVRPRLPSRASPRIDLAMNNDVRQASM
jgi:transposase